MRGSVGRMRCWPGYLAWSCWLASLCGLPGCSGEDRSLPSGPVKPSFPGVRLAVGALGDSAILTGLSAQRGEWSASRGGEIAIKDEPIRSLDNLSDVDLLIFPGQELGNLVDADVLEIIPNQVVLPARPQEDESAQAGRTESTEESPGEAFQYTDIAPAFREQVTKYGTDRMALPLGGSALVLVYRRDAFSRQPTSTPHARPGSRWSPPRPGPSSTPWPGSFREGTGTATARPITGSRRSWARTPRASATRPSWPGQPAWASIATSTRSSSTPTR